MLWFKPGPVHEGVTQEAWIRGLRPSMGSVLRNVVLFVVAQAWVLIPRITLPMIRTRALRGRGIRA